MFRHVAVLPAKVFTSALVPCIAWTTSVLTQAQRASPIATRDTDIFDQAEGGGVTKLRLANKPSESAVSSM
jgi:hypothetical protein